MDILSESKCPKPTHSEYNHPVHAPTARIRYQSPARANRKKRLCLRLICAIVILMDITRIWLPLSSFLVREWESLYKIFRQLFALFMREQNQGIYEILAYETTLELSTTGKTATFLKRQKVRFLQDNIISFQDYAWGDGEIFADYQVSPGVVADRYQVGDRWHILISLRQMKRRGDLAEFFITATFKDAFLGREEWQQVEIRHHTQQLKMTIIFPKNRHCQRAVIQQRRRHWSIALDSQQMSVLPDGRQVVIWETKNIEPLEVYTLWWTW